MIYKWETDEERLTRFMKISPKKKMEWLRQMNEFVHKTSTKHTRAIRQKLRKSR
jgi:hypothetical protein